MVGIPSTGLKLFERSMYLVFQKVIFEHFEDELQCILK